MGVHSTRTPILDCVQWGCNGCQVTKAFVFGVPGFYGVALPYKQWGVPIMRSWRILEPFYQGTFRKASRKHLAGFWGIVPAAKASPRVSHQVRFGS